MLRRQRAARIAITIGIAIATVGSVGTRLAAAAPAVDASHEACTSCHRVVAPASASASAHGKRSAVAAMPATGGTGVVGPRVACVECHAAQGPGSAPVASAHGAFECQACHDPHSSDLPGRFRLDRLDASVASTDFDSETRLCVSCHFEAGQFKGLGGGFVRHPVGIMAPRHTRRVIASTEHRSAAGSRGSGGQLAMPLARLESQWGIDQDVIGCGTCHSLHGSRNPFQLRWAAAQQVDACTSCHQEVVQLEANGLAEFPGAALMGASQAGGHSSSGRELHAKE